MKGRRSFVLLLIVLLLVLAACRSSRQDTGQEPTQAEIEDRLALGTREGALRRGCPEPGEIMYLWFSHFSILDQDFGGGETFHLEFENQPPSHFLLSFNQ